MAKRLAKVVLNSKEDTTKVNSKMENLMEEVFITFLIQVKFMMVISRRIIWMGKDLWFGQMSLDMKEISKWEKLKVKGLKNSQMEIGM
jgi:hypothetical protein|tara:strand:- start:23 stop:286 length:264 start_codon:yes stop_codon:yes gene_type:complete